MEIERGLDVKNYFDSLYLKEFLWIINKRNITLNVNILNKDYISFKASRINFLFKFDISVVKLQADKVRIKWIFGESARSQSMDVRNARFYIIAKSGEGRVVNNFIFFWKNLKIWICICKLLWFFAIFTFC